MKVPFKNFTVEPSGTDGWYTVRVYPSPNLEQDEAVQRAFIAWAIQSKLREAEKAAQELEALKGK